MELNREFLPYNEALALKELGFNEPCFGFFDKDDNQVLKFDVVYENKNLSAPLYQQAFRFFREKFNLFCFVSSFSITEHDFTIDYKGAGHINVALGEKFYDTYEEAELASLRKLIEIAKKQ